MPAWKRMMRFYFHNGKHFLLELPYCNSEMFQLFSNEFSKQEEDEFKIMILDNGSFHHAKALAVPKNMALIFLPPYSPELNPAEKVWWLLKREIKNKFFLTLNNLQQQLTRSIKQLTDCSIQHLTAFDYYTSNFWTIFN